MGYHGERWIPPDMEQETAQIKLLYDLLNCWNEWQYAGSLSEKMLTALVASLRHCKTLSLLCQVTRHNQRCGRLRRLDSLVRRFLAWLCAYAWIDGDGAPEAESQSLESSALRPGYRPRPCHSRSEKVRRFPHLVCDPHDAAQRERCRDARLYHSFINDDRRTTRTEIASGANRTRGAVWVA